jgi:enoyl-[acyl-carrier protein] reductase II
VNIPLLYPDLKEIFDIVAEEKIDVVITSAGNPATWTAHLKSAGSMVIHVVSNTKFAIKAEQAGVDAIVAEGFEAGGHNGREETTTFCLIPMIKKTVQIPIIAAGGIGSGSGMLAAMALGAEGVQIGSRFVATVESSAHEHFKQKLLACREGDTSLHMKQLTPVRLLKNGFQQQVANAEARGAGAEELQILLGRGRAKKGMFEGDMEEGELEIGQIAALIRDIQPAADVVEEIMEEFRLEKEKLCKSVF